MTTAQTGIGNSATGVELHVHLDGSLTAGLLTELCKKHQIKLPDLTLEELHSKITVPGRAQSLTEVLDPFFFFTPIIAGHAAVLEDLAYHFVKRQYDNGVLYTEVRYSPHILAGNLPLEKVVEAISSGLKKGEKEYGIMVRTILCVLRNLGGEKGAEVVPLAKKFRNNGVVGIDLAGDESKFPNDQFFDVFDKAKAENLNITVHAGEASGSESVQTAVERLHAQRIGHGYRITESASVYNMIKERKVMLEICPTSSWRTAAVNENLSLHPLNQFIKDGINWSISTDDPGLFDIQYTSEIEFSKKTFSITDSQYMQSLLRAAEASFLPESEKASLISLLRSRMGLSML